MALDSLLGHRERLMDRLFRSGSRGEGEKCDFDLSLHEARYTVFDTELTGLQPRRDSIVAFGAVRMEGGRILLGDHFDRLVEPRTALTGDSVVIHGITPSEASESPNVDTILPEFLEYCRGTILVGHVVSLDLMFVNREMKRLYQSTITNPAVDTFSLYHFLQRKAGESDAYTTGLMAGGDLFSVAKKYDIRVYQAHHALGDAYVTAQIFQRFLGELRAYGIRTLRELLKAGKP